MQFAPYLRATPETTDDELVAAVRRGDDQAFERLYERYHRRIAAYIYGMVNDYGRAEDIAQDVFMSALRRMRETDRPIAFKPWVYEIAKNACIDQFRRSRRTEEVSFDADEGMGAADYGRLVTTGPSPDVAVDTKMSLDHLCGAFGGLSDTHHQILVMRELEGLSYREIGERLGMSRPSVESTLFRARRRLGEEYEELISGERCARVQRIIAAAAEGTLGTRDQRKLAKHVAHCQACRREARVAGIEAGLAAKRPQVRSRIAAFLPLPAFLRRRLENDEVGLGGASLGHHAPALAQWSAHLSATVDPAIAGWARAATAAAAAAAVAVAGVGGGASGDERKVRSVTPASAVATQAPAPGVPRVDRAAVGGQADTAATTRGARAGGTATAQRDAPAAGALTMSGEAPATPATVDAPAPADATPSLAPVTNLAGSDPTGVSTTRPQSGEKNVLDQVSDSAGSLPEVPVSAVAPTLADGSGTRDGVESTVTGTVNTATDTLTNALAP